MSITFVSAGAVAAGETSLAIARPANIQANDILIMIGCSVADSGLTLPDGWTLIDVVNGVHPRLDSILFAAWKRTDGIEDDYFEVSGLYNSCCGVVGAFRGCIETGSPIDDLTTLVSAYDLMVICGAVIGAKSYVYWGSPYSNRASGSTYIGDDSSIGFATWLNTSQVPVQNYAGPFTFWEKDGYTVAIRFTCGLIPIPVDAKVGTVQIQTIYDTDEQVPKVLMGAVQLQVIWDEGIAEPPAPGHRTFPLPNEKTGWQSQTGKRAFPLAGTQ